MTAAPSTSPPTSSAPTIASSSVCANVSNPIGTYQCQGDCFELTGLVAVASDSDKNVISAIEDAAGLFEIEISFNDEVTEIEYGGLAGSVLYAAAAATSNHIYDVLSEYTFFCGGEGGNGEVVGYTKSVRVPIPGAFKVCSLHCVAVDEFGTILYPYI